MGRDGRRVYILFQWWIENTNIKLTRVFYEWILNVRWWIFVCFLLCIQNKKIENWVRFGTITKTSYSVPSYPGYAIRTKSKIYISGRYDDFQALRARVYKVVW